MDIDGKKILRGAIAGRPLVTAVGADQVLILDDTDGEPKRALASDLGGGLADIVDDTTPQLGGALDVNGQEITGAIDLHSTGDVILELGDQAGSNKVSIRDSAGTEVLSMASDGAFNASTINPSNGSLLVTLGDASGVDDFSVLNSGATLKFNVDSNGNVKALGKLDLGHSTDTTLTRVSAGLVSIEGDNIITAAATQTVTNKSIDSANNTITNIVNADIKSDAAIAASKLESITTTNGQLKLVSVQDSDALTENQLVAWDANGNLESQPVYVDGSGNVGIGTASPAQKMDVRGDTATIYQVGNNNSGSYTGARVVADHSDADSPVLQFGANDGSHTWIQSRTLTGSGTSLPMRFQIGPGAAITAMSIDTAGNVGIGTTSPTALVHADQSSASGAMPVLRLDQADIDDSFIDFIGTSAADGTRSISSDTTEDSAKFGAIRIEINGVTKWIRIYDDES